MNIVFAGTPDFASSALSAIIQAGFDVSTCLTQPDRPSGRGMRLTPSSVKQTALEHSIDVLQPLGLRLDGKYAEDAQSTMDYLTNLKPDVIVVAAYGLILPQWILDLPKYGCLNIHASLLPRWRGAAPIQRAIQSGDEKSGITIMQMDAGLDTGDILFKLERNITEQDTAQSLHDALAADGASAIVSVLRQLSAGQTIQAEPQPDQGVTYAHKLNKSESVLDLVNNANDLALKIRAFNPFPGTNIILPGIDKPVKIWQAQAISDYSYAQAEPGTILNASKDGIDIATGKGILRILELQRPGGRRQQAADFIQGWVRS